MKRGLFGEGVALTDGVRTVGDKVGSTRESVVVREPPLQSTLRLLNAVALFQNSKEVPPPLTTIPMVPRHFQLWRATNVPYPRL